jgi:hypothetical protein
LRKNFLKARCRWHCFTVRLVMTSAFGDTL